MTATLFITDGTDMVDLLAGGFRLKEWKPAIPQEKGGGVWQSSFFSDGRVPVTEGPYDNAVETFEMVANSKNQNATIRDTQNLRRLARRAKDYFATKRTTAPVWIVAKAEKETNLRYAIIYGWQTGPDGNPFSSPFNHWGQAAMGEFTLILERGHWRSTEPGDSDCIAVRQPPEYTVSDEYTYYSTLDTDDGYNAQFNDAIGGWQPNQMELGQTFAEAYFFNDANPNNQLRSVAAVIFKNVTAPSVTRWAASATLRVVAYENSQDIELDIYGFDQDNTATLSTGADLLARPLTDAYAVAFSGAWTAGVTYEADVTDIVNEIVVRAGWSFGNSIGFWIVGHTGDFGVQETKRFATREHLTYDPPELVIEWVDDTTTQLTTCDPIIVANQNPGTDVDYLLFYDAGAPAYFDLSNAYPPFGIFPGGIWAATGDILYIGCQYVFGCVVFNLGTASADVTSIDWEYWNGAAWVDMSERDNTINFSATGKNTLTWVPLENTGWVKNTINGVNAYWIRGVLTVGSATPARPIQTRWRVKDHPVIPYVDVPANDDHTLADGASYTIGVGGDLPALLKVSAEYQGQYSYLSEPYGLTVGERSMDRELSAALSAGGVFNAYINLSDYTSKPLYPSRTLVLGDDCSYANFLGAPHGRCVLYNPNDTLFAERVRVRLLSASDYGVKNFGGRYHAYLRLVQTGGSTGDFYFQLNVCGVYTEKKYFTDHPVIDFGVVEINGNRVDISSEYTIIVLGANTRASVPGDCYLTDLVLIPVDQYVGRFDADGYPEYADYGDTITIDSAEVTSADIDAHIDDGSLDYVMQKDSSGPVTIANNERVRLWFLFSKEIKDHVFKVRLYKTQRYLSARGDR